MFERQQVQEAARRIRNALTQLGYYYDTLDGHRVEVSFKSLGLVGDSYGLLEVDTQRLPRKVRIDRLVHPNTLHHLAAVVGKPVRRLNTTGLTYCVVLKPRPEARARLPKRAEFDPEDRPAGDFMAPIGVGLQGAVWRSLFDLGHVLVGGESGSGKSTWLHACLAALLTAHGPDELKIAVVDPKEVEFLPYQGIPHLLGSVATDVDEAAGVVAQLSAEMDRRRRLFAARMARSLRSYNAQADAPLPLVLAVVDEVTDVALEAGLRSAFYTGLIRLTSKARAFGLHLVLATQNPKAEVLNTLIRGNMSTRIAFRVATAEHSRNILGEGGAQRLPRTVRGRLLARLDAGLVELQGYYLGDEDVLAVTRALGGAQSPTLTGDQADLVRYALDELEGAFTVGKLASAFEGRLTHWQVRRLAERWEREGLLTTPAHATDTRRVTPQLAEMLGEATG
jgi:phosphoglycolate phosphatase-like HAD superfamily hydrolase